jgi:glycosyltransferase involved in cell wall biosynthesis
VCNNTSNLAWGEKVQKHCDLIFSETIPALDYMKTGDKVIREPTTMCLDPFFWHPNLEIPEHLIITKEPGEVLIYHAVGNYDYRNTDDRNIKGTPYIVAAVDRLKLEGLNVRLIFFTNIPNTEVRFYQAQADIIVDQLNYGRYGATAREGMMLGKPVVCYINTFEYDENDKLISLDECPLISASEQEVYDAIKDLVINPEKRFEVGKRGREYALKWHSADACAERYEQYYDTLFS